jgi:hypothetical protein
MTGQQHGQRHVSVSGLDRFQDDRVGNFVRGRHYSLIGANEWVMFHDRYPVEEYEKLVAPDSTPTGSSSLPQTPASGT